MDKNLPARPNLDHLRRQAKSLLAALQSKDPQAISAIQQFLPAAKGKSAKQAGAMVLRLADAQLAIARQNGFAGWPPLARDVEQLRALEGTWDFARLEIDGSAFPVGALTSCHLLIDGDRFRTETPEANYEGVFNINVETEPHEIDIEFVEGPEAGNWNHGIFRLDGDQLEICLDVNGKPRPNAFRTSAGSGHAYETLNRGSRSRPRDVTGGTAPAPRQSLPAQECSRFEFVESPTMAKLQGQWKAVKLIRDGIELPQMMLASGLRVATKNEVKISFGGRVMIHASFRLDESADPMQVDYCSLDEANKGQVQQGLFMWVGDEACFCMAAPGHPRPTDFTCATGSGRTLSQWRVKK